MGYNNYGMHFVHWNHYGKYEDLKRYDKMEEQKRAALMRNQNLESEDDDYDIDSNCTIDDDVKTEEKMSEKTNNNSKSTAKKPNRKRNQNTNNRSNKLRPPYQFGTEEIIPEDDYAYASLIRMNIFLIGYENSIDVVDAICKCSKKIIKDAHINPKAETERDVYTVTYPKTEHAFLFLIMLARELEVEISDFFIFDEESIEERLLGFLNETQYYTWDCYYAKSENVEHYSLHLSWYELLIALKIDTTYNINGFGVYESASHPLHNPSLALHKYILSDGKIVYGVEIGDLNVNAYTQYDYMLTGADVYYDKPNTVTKFIDELIQYNKDDFVSDEDE